MYSVNMFIHITCPFWGNNLLHNAHLWSLRLSWISWMCFFKTCLVEKKIPDITTEFLFRENRLQCLGIKQAWKTLWLGRHFYSRHIYNRHFCFRHFYSGKIAVRRFYSRRNNRMVDQSVFQNCKKTEPGTIFLKICLDLAYSIDSKKGLTFENPTFNSWLISKTVFD